MKKFVLSILIIYLCFLLVSCNTYNFPIANEEEIVFSNEISEDITLYEDINGDKAYIPKDFKISTKDDEQIIKNGLVIIGIDDSEYVWVPTNNIFDTRDFGSYYSSGDNFSRYSDEKNLGSYKNMVTSVNKFGGFYISRYEASKGSSGLPASKKVSPENPGQIWVQISPDDIAKACANLYLDNNTVNGFFPWGINWDTTLSWIILTGNKTYDQVANNSISWGNYSDDSFSLNARGNYTGIYEDAKANNIYDLAGNNWEWTRERNGSNYVMRGGGYNLMGGSCSGARYPAALRDPLPGNNHHPNVTFRIGLYLI